MACQYFAASAATGARIASSVLIIIVRVPLVSINQAAGVTFADVAVCRL